MKKVFEAQQGGRFDYQPHPRLMLKGIKDWTLLILGVIYWFLVMSFVIPEIFICGILVEIRCIYKYIKTKISPPANTENSPWQEYKYNRRRYR